MPKPWKPWDRWGERCACSGRATEVIRHLAAKSQGQFPIIGVGGIDSVEAAQEKLDAGASLVQVYSGMIYQGPSLPSRLVQGLA